jgi:hypothetical protein
MVVDPTHLRPESPGLGRFRATTIMERATSLLWIDPAVPKADQVQGTYKGGYVLSKPPRKKPY